MAQQTKLNTADRQAIFRLSACTAGSVCSSGAAGSSQA